MYIYMYASRCSAYVHIFMHHMDWFIITITTTTTVSSEVWKDFLNLTCTPISD